MPHPQRHTAVYVLIVALLGGPSTVMLAQASETGTGARRAVLLGKVLDDVRETPLEGVTIEIAGSTSRVVTNAHGAFIISLSSEQQLALTLTRIGYHQLTQLVYVSASDTSRISFFLAPAVTTLDTVNVAADAVSRSPRLAGYEHRRHQHIGGVFITRAQIERRKAVATSQFFYGMLGVRVVDSGSVKLLASTRGPRPTDQRTIGDRASRMTIGGLDLAPCYMSIGVDGQLKEWGFSVDEIPPNDIYGIEVYSGPATMPREFAALRPDGYCGLVMIWTRADQ